MRKIVYLLLALSLVACSTQEEAALKKPELSSNEMLVKIRANQGVQNELVFQAMPDDTIVDLMDQANKAEQAGDYQRANEYLEAALRFNSSNPEVTQLKAEIALLLEAWSSAEQLALKSYEFGPKLGNICRRNWLTVHYAKAAQGKPMADYELAKNLNECTIVPPARL
jgi:tetratricopeptide (TPR) repeat protein